MVCRRHSGCSCSISESIVVEVSLGHTTQSAERVGQLRMPVGCHRTTGTSNQWAAQPDVYCEASWHS